MYRHHINMFFDVQFTFYHAKSSQWVKNSKWCDIPLRVLDALFGDCVNIIWNLFITMGSSIKTTRWIFNKLQQIKKSRLARSSNTSSNIIGIKYLICLNFYQNNFKNIIFWNMAKWMSSKWNCFKSRKLFHVQRQQLGNTAKSGQRIVNPQEFRRTLQFENLNIIFYLQGHCFCAVNLYVF